MKRLFHAQLKRVLNRLGYVVVPIAPLDLRGLTDDPIHATYIAGCHNCVIEVPLAHCRTALGFPYTLDSLQPFVRTIRQFIEGRASTYDESPLQEYYEHFNYEHFRPKTVLELLDLPGVANSALLEFPPSAYVLPWETRSPAEKLRDTTTVMRREEIGRSADFGVGPVSTQKGELEFRALVRLTESIRRQGYVRHNGPDGDIVATPLIDSARGSRYVVRGGKHRIAVLAALGFEYAPLRVSFVHAPRLAEAGHWPHVKDGLFTRDQALTLFKRIFEGHPPIAAIPAQWRRDENENIRVLTSHLTQCD